MAAKDKKNDKHNRAKQKNTSSAGVSTDSRRRGQANQETSEPANSKSKIFSTFTLWNISFVFFGKYRPVL